MKPEIFRGFGTISKILDDDLEMGPFLTTPRSKGNLLLDPLMGEHTLDPGHALSMPLGNCVSDHSRNLRHHLAAGGRCGLRSLLCRNRTKRSRQP